MWPGEPLTSQQNPPFNCSSHSTTLCPWPFEFLDQLLWGRGKKELRDRERGGRKRERDKEGEVARLRVAKIKKNLFLPLLPLSLLSPFPPLWLSGKTVLTFSVLIGRADSDWQRLPWQRHNDTPQTNRKAKQNVSMLHSLWI